jgi:hypothetical protein
MQHYCIYVIGQDGHFIKSLVISCEDDNAAIAATKPLMDDHDLELWHPDRRIAQFDSRLE